MQIGTRVIAPQGFRSIPKDVPHHFLSNHGKSGRVLLVRFDWDGRNSPKAVVISFERAEFEAAALEGDILPTEEQPTLPPWLASLEGQNLGRRDADRSKSKESHKERIEKRLLFIARVLNEMPAILASDDVTRTLNQYALEATPQQNQTRFRLWVLTYLCFGRNFWSLLPPFHVAGRWDRHQFAQKKMGAPSRAYGNKYGYGMSKEMAEKCHFAYTKQVQTGKTLLKIYEEAMRIHFRCIPVSQASGLMVYSHPEGKPFPTYRQFRYQIDKEFGITTVQKNRYGSARHRNRLTPSKGKYSEDVANLMEKIESDGYYTKEHPKGYLEGSVLPPLCVVTSRDILSGALLGIGFSFGAEQGAAYRAMLFCMAVPKDYYCSLWGINIKLEDWPSHGLPPHYKVDRGPGSSLSLVHEDAKPVIRNIVESWSGQSKATIESSHRRETKLEGQPTYFETNYTPVDLCRKEIFKLLMFNQKADMSGRLEIDRDLAFVPPIPLAIWNHYDARGRNSAISISIDDAVRQFLTPVTLKASTDGIIMDGRRYSSKELMESGFLERIARAGGKVDSPQGYILDLNIRHVWIEVDGQIFKLDAQLKIREDEELLYISLAELKQWNDARAQVNSEMQIHFSAAQSHTINQFESESGKKWEDGKRNFGRRKNSASSRQETQEVRQHTAKRKAS